MQKLARRPAAWAAALLLLACRLAPAQTPLHDSLAAQVARAFPCGPLKALQKPFEKSYRKGWWQNEQVLYRLEDISKKKPLDLLNAYKYDALRAQFKTQILDDDGLRQLSAQMLAHIGDGTRFDRPAAMCALAHFMHRYYAAHAPSIPNPAVRGLYANLYAAAAQSVPPAPPPVSDSAPLPPNVRPMQDTAAASPAPSSGLDAAPAPEAWLWVLALLAVAVSVVSLWMNWRLYLRNLSIAHTPMPAISPEDLARIKEVAHQKTPPQMPAETPDLPGAGQAPLPDMQAWVTAELQAFMARINQQWAAQMLTEHQVKAIAVQAAAAAPAPTDPAHAQALAAALAPALAPLLQPELAKYFVPIGEMRDLVLDAAPTSDEVRAWVRAELAQQPAAPDLAWAAPLNDLAARLRQAEADRDMLSADIQQLHAAMAELQQRPPHDEHSAPAPPPPLPPLPEPEPTPASLPEGADGTQTWYAPAPQSGLFYGRHLHAQHISRETIYQLTALNAAATEAAYMLVNDPQTITHALNMPGEYLTPAVELRGEGNIKLARSVKAYPGRAVREGANWRIVEKGIVEFLL